jgi:hypothetical protein
MRPWERNNSHNPSGPQKSHNPSTLITAVTIITLVPYHNPSTALTRIIQPGLPAWAAGVLKDDVVTHLSTVVGYSGENSD